MIQYIDQLYFVSQKNIISRIIPTTQPNSISSTTNISRQITKLRKRLWDVEQLATIAIAEEIRCNPPKALMAVIGPAAKCQGWGRCRRCD